DHPRGPQVEERRRVLSCECQFLIGSYIFPEDLRDPESSTCTVDLSIPVETGRPPFCRMLKKASCCVLARSDPRRTLRVCITERAFPFVKTHSKGERPTRSAVCTSSVFRSLRPCQKTFLNIRRISGSTGNSFTDVHDTAQVKRMLGSLHFHTQ